MVPCPVVSLKTPALQEISIRFVRLYGFFCDRTFCTQARFWGWICGGIDINRMVLGMHGTVYNGYSW